MCQQHLLYVAIVSSQALALSAGTLIPIRGRKRPKRWASTLYKKEKPNEIVVYRVHYSVAVSCSLEGAGIGLLKTLILIKDKRN